MHNSIWYDSIWNQQSRLLHASAALASLALLCSAPLVAQTKPAAGQAHPPAVPQSQQPAAQTPAPDWPINDQPRQAAVTWNQDQLKIDASNSSLQQIMTDIASATGASVDGMNKDERVFGNYGPAPARDVLTQLLQGSGYNLVLLGDQGQGVPKQILLSARNASKTSQPAVRPQADEPEEEPIPEPQYEPPVERPQPVNVPPSRPNMMPGAPAGMPIPQQPGQQPGQPQPNQQPNQQPNNQ